MTPTSLATPAELDLLAARGWPARITQEIDGWVARAADGVTRRANSVLTVGAVTDLKQAIVEAERFYREQGLPAIFQVSDATQPANLAAELANRGYRREGETLAQVATVAEVTGHLASISADEIATVSISEQPDEAWTTMWWSVDGRGGEPEREVARAIMTASPALYAAVHDESGVAAGARLALLENWGALFSLVVRPNARRQGLATRVLAALVAEATTRGVDSLCLQVLATSHGALAFYESLGFSTASNYRYWVQSTD